MNLLSPTLATTNAVSPQRPAVPIRVDRDAKLLAALRRRDRTAAECLVAHYGSRAYRLAMGITRNAQDAEETVNYALWSVIRKIETFRGDSSLGSWIYRIVANAAYEKLRGRANRRDEISLDEVLPLFHEDGLHSGPTSDWSASIDDPAMQTELRAMLDSAIGELPAHYRAVVVLHDVEGLSMAEVAGSLGITVATAKSRAHRGRLFLRKRLAVFMSDATASIGAGLKSGTWGRRRWSRPNSSMTRCFRSSPRSACAIRGAAAQTSSQVPMAGAGFRNRRAGDSAAGHGRGE